MKEVLPPEIINISVENHFSKFSKDSNIIYWTAILILLTACALSFMIKITITVRTKGIIRAVSEPVHVIAPVNAKVIKTSVSENKLVKKGDTLVYLDKKKHIEKICHIRNLITKNNTCRNDINKMLDSDPDNIKTPLFQTAWDEYHQKIVEFDLNVNLLEKSFKRNEILFDKGVIAAVEKEEKEYQLENIIEEKNAFIKQSRNQWYRMITEYENANINYYNEINILNNEMKNHFIISPCSGSTVSFNGIQPGSYVTAGQTIAVISPEDSLISENLVSPKNIGFLRKNMPVSYQVDAYNYNEWGLATGKIIDISKEIIMQNDQPFFKVRCNINEQYLKLKNGCQGKIKKGLTMTTRFNVTKRTLAQLLFDKTDNWLNPNIINENQD